ncbi:hypothetical protein VTN00DRAFT_2863 [Thermoascus crustaceus]|uniref:uncharacterized protein n=1 Tax=Thermoascus crustaceus TaxID=5088 RepID=UPI0037443B6E
MRQISTFLALTLAGALRASAYEAFAYTFDFHQKLPSSHDGGVPEDTAKLVLEQRMRSSQSSVLGTVNEEVVERLNQFGGGELPLFGSAEEHENPQRLLIVCEGVDSKAVSSLLKTFTNDFYIPYVSTNFASDDFFKTLLGISPTLQGDPKRCAYNFDIEGGLSGALSSSLSEARECLSRNSIFRGALNVLDESLLTQFSSMAVDSWVGETETAAVLRLKLQQQNDYTDQTVVSKVLGSLFSDLEMWASESQQETTVLLLPSPSKDRKTSPNIRPRYDSKKEFLPKSSNSIFDSHESQDIPTEIRASVPSTLMPVCYASNSSCVDATNNCSGHGRCYRKYASKNEAASSDCYACKCVDTVIRKKDGSIKRIQWGGSACEKRDVSTPFFLLAGITVVIMAAVGSGIGMLFSVGQEELPSVIGAGVAAPRAQR